MHNNIIKTNTEKQTRKQIDNNILSHERYDHWLIGNIVSPGSTLLDMGCGKGELLELLKNKNQVKGKGIEKNEQAIYYCVEKGLSVFHMDFESGLSVFPDRSFDYVVMNRSLQETNHLEYVLMEALRVGRQVIIGFPNFAYINARIQLFFNGVTPVTDSLPHLWYNTPNLHFLSIADFRQYVKNRSIVILENHYFTRKRRCRFLPNLLAMNAIFVISQKK